MIKIRISHCKRVLFWNVFMTVKKLISKWAHWFKNLTQKALPSFWSSDRDCISLFYRPFPSVYLLCIAFDVHTRALFSLNFSNWFYMFCWPLLIAKTRGSDPPREGVSSGLGIPADGVPPSVLLFFWGSTSGMSWCHGDIICCRKE